MLILTFPEGFKTAQQLAAATRLPIATITLHHFPDGESLVQLPVDLPPQVIVYQSLDQPNSKLIELLLLAEAARDQGVKQLILVAPYLCYMRQDKAFMAGQAISQQIVGKFLARLFDVVITVDPHLHRVHQLGQAVPADLAIALSASVLIGAFIQNINPQTLLVGPDAESRQWVEEVAKSGDLDFVVAKKIRHGDRSVEISFPEFVYAGRDITLVDDMASSGHTLATAANLLFAEQARSINVVVTHALFMDKALALIKDTGVAQIWSTDSISHPTNSISLTPLLAKTVMKIIKTEVE